MFLVALILMALTGCATPDARLFPRHFEPGHVNLLSPNQAIVFGKFVRAISGETKADEERSLALIPFKDAPLKISLKQRFFSWSLPSNVKYDVTVNKESHFYVVIERDSYVIAGFSFGNPNPWASFRGRGHYGCFHFGFHMPEQADAYYIGTVFFDLKWGVLPLFSLRGTVRVRDEFEEEVRAFKRRNPKFTGKIVNSLVVADNKSVPLARASRFGKNLKPQCYDKGPAHFYDIIYE